MPSSSWRFHRWRGVLATVLSIAVLAGMLVFWWATRAKDEAAAELARNVDFRFTETPMERAAPQGVEALPASPDFVDVARLGDEMVAAARAGILVYEGGGRLVRSYRVGLELPPAEPGPITAGLLAGAAQPELFIATRGAGWLVFDGARFRQVLPDDKTLRTITAVLPLASGRILLGTEKRGVLVFDGRRLRPLHSALGAEHITALAGTEGDLWIGTLRNGVFHHRGGELLDLRRELPDPQVLSLAADGATAWVGTPLGATEFQNGRRVRTLGEGLIAQSLARHGDWLEIGTEDQGVAAVPLQPQPGRRAWRADVGPPAIRRVVVLEGDLYAVAAGAVYRREAPDGSWQPALSAPGALLADRNVAALAVSGGRLWVGYFDHGLDIVSTALDRVEHHEDDTLFCVNRIVPDPLHDRTAVATANGLALFDARAQARQVMGRRDGLLADHVADVALRGDGMVVATAAGLSFVDRSGVRSLYAFHGLVNNHVYTVATRGSQTMAGTLGGLSVLDDDTVRANYTTANSALRLNWITAVVRSGGDWYTGTYGAGVLRFDGAGAWHSFPELREGFVVNPNAMLAIEGFVYAGSLDRGLFVYDPAAGRWRNTTAGLPSLNVTALAAGGGYLYVGTDNGVVRMPEGAMR